MKLHTSLLLHGEICLGEEGGPAADISRERRAGQGRAAARGKLLIITEIKLMRKSAPLRFSKLLRTPAVASWTSALLLRRQLCWSHGETRKDTELLFFPAVH